MKKTRMFLLFAIVPSMVALAAWISHPVWVDTAAITYPISPDDAYGGIAPGDAGARRTAVLSR